jgi:chromosome segregation ATPase
MSKEQEATQDDRHFVDCQCPAHKAELLATKEAALDGIERAQEQAEILAAIKAFAASEVSRVEAALAELKRERDNWRTACTLASSEKYKAESEVKKFVEVANQNARDRNNAVDQWESAEQQLAAERKRSGELENALRAARALLASQIEAAKEKAK